MAMVAIETIRTRDLSTLCISVTGVLTVTFRFRLFIALRATATVMKRGLAY